MQPSIHSRQRANTTQRTTMVTRPALIQMVHFLEQPIQALEAELQAELSSNPALELVDPDPLESPLSNDELHDVGEPEYTGNGSDRESTTSRSPDLPTEDEKPFLPGDQITAADFERHERVAREYPDAFEEDSFRPGRNQLDDWSEQYDDRMASIEDPATNPDRPTLAESLREQLIWFDLDPELRTLAQWIIDRLDEDGRLPVPLEQLASYPSPESATEPDEPQSSESAPDLSRLPEALTLIQKLEPRGVGARDLRESLLLQIDDQTPNAPELRILLERYSDELLHNRQQRISKETGWSRERLSEILTSLKSLNPHPGSEFRHERSLAIVPDMAVVQEVDETTGKSRFLVQLRRSWLTRVRVDTECRNWIRSLHVPTSVEISRMSEEERQEQSQWRSLQQNLRRAEEFVSAIPLRQSTLQKVAQAIVDHQSAFLEHGPRRLRPLRMEDIAKQTEMDVSTVSRAVRDKWIETPQGTIPLKRFFTGSTQSGTGESISLDVVRVRLREMIHQEDKRYPLSDERLRSEMAKLGFQVSRRAITDYRNEMGIPDSRLRRQY